MVGLLSGRGPVPRTEATRKEPATATQPPTTPGAPTLTATGRPADDAGQEEWTQYLESCTDPLS